MEEEEREVRGWVSEGSQEAAKFGGNGSASKAVLAKDGWKNPPLWFWAREELSGFRDVQEDAEELEWFRCCLADRESGWCGAECV